MKLFARPNLINDYHLLAYDVLDSTNEEAKRLAEGGGVHGAVVWSKKQTAGKGRQDRKWISQEGNLFCSILLSPNTEIKTFSQLSFVAAVAAVETLRSIIPDEAETISCKWPNDILINNKKIGGILLESFETFQEDSPANRTRWVVVGIGINIDSCPSGMDFPATYLKESGVEIISAKIVLSRFIHHFINCYEIWARKGFTPIRKHWIDAAYKIGKPVEIRLPKNKYNGIFEGIDMNGHLLVRKNDGTRSIVSAGDVSFS